MSGYLEIVQTDDDIFQGTKKSDLVVWAPESNQSVYIGVSSNAGLILKHDKITINTDIDSEGVNSVFRGKSDDSKEHPSFSWSNNCNMGMFKESENSFGFSTNGIAKLFVTENGIGVGTSDPESEFEVKGTITSTSHQTVSDARFKENIEPITSIEALEKVMKINGYNFNYTEDKTKKNRSGLLAQELKDIHPQCVNVDNNDFLKVSYNDLIPVLVESIKELNNRITELENKNGS